MTNEEAFIQLEIAFLKASRDLPIETQKAVREAIDTLKEELLNKEDDRK